MGLVQPFRGDAGTVFCRDTEVILRDAQAKELRIDADSIERLAPQTISLMPELLLRDLTARQVADLTEYLSSLN